MTKYASLALVALVAACGADAPPEPPAQNPVSLSISGDARIGVQREW